MINSRRLLPSTSMLTAFDAAARSGSFTAAAKELNLTQGAISKQINSLEKLLDIALFVRHHQTVSLTEPGRAYAKEIAMALGHIRSASLRAITRPQGGVLNLAVLPTFGTRWLMPRLPRFLQAYPDITVSFVTRLSPFDFRTEDIHAAIHYGASNWPYADSTYLMGEVVVPVCSSQFMQQHEITQASDLARVPLLHISSRADAWQNWFASQNIAVPHTQGMYLEQFITAAQAAIAGMGAALLPEFLVQGELQRQELVIIDAPKHNSHYGYHLVIPYQQTNHNPSQLFRKWLLEQVEYKNSI